MNGFLWLGVIATLVLVASVVFDGLDVSFDALDLGGDLLSLPVLAAFVGAFGFGTGAAWDAFGAPALALGLVAGGAFGYLAVRLVRVVDLDAAGSADQAEALLGSIGRVLTPPNATGIGEIMLDRPDGPRKIACRSDGPLVPGAEVVVVDVSSSTLVTVQPVTWETP